MTIERVISVSNRTALGLPICVDLPLVNLYPLRRRFLEGANPAGRITVSDASSPAANFCDLVTNQCLREHGARERIGRQTR
jgi:hypothetical protein